MASKLPSEIISLIAQFASQAEYTENHRQEKVHRSLVPFSLVCKRWQAAFESEIWADITILSPSESEGITVGREAPRPKHGITLENLVAFTTGPHQWKVSRRKAIRRMLYRVAVPHWLDFRSKGKDDDFSYDNPYRHENNAAFEAGMKALFSFLPQWASDQRFRLSIVLQAEDVYTSDQEIEPNTVIMGDDYFTPYLADFHPECCLPEVSCISALDFPEAWLPAAMGAENSISNRAALVISQSCGSDALEAFYLRDRCVSVPHTEWRHAVEDRQVTADNLSRLPRSVRCLHIEWSDRSTIGQYPRDDDSGDDESNDDYCTLANPLDIRIKPDCLSAALRDVATRLYEIRMQGLAIAPDLFRVQSSDSRWPQLKTLHLDMIPLALPSGENLSYRFDNCDKFDPKRSRATDVWRQPYWPRRNGNISVSFSYFDVLFESIGEASTSMPFLESLLVSFQREHKVEISMRGGKRVVAFRSKFGYSPSMSVLKAWKLSKESLKLQRLSLEAEYAVWPPQER